MIEKPRTTIQNQSYRIDIAAAQLTAEQAAEAIAGFFHSTAVCDAEKGFYRIEDYLERPWVIQESNCERNVASCIIHTPSLAYEDLDECLLLVQESREAGASGGDGCGIRLYVSTEDWPCHGIRNLKNIVSSRLTILAHALAEPHWEKRDVPRRQPDETGMMEVFPSSVAQDLDPKEMKACIQLGLGIASQAANQKWANANPVRAENERYAFRCWMLRLGLKGDEYKSCRMRFLKRLEGDSSFKDGRKPS